MVYKYLIKNYNGDINVDINNLWNYSLVARNNDIRNMKWKLWSLDRKNNYYFDEYECEEFYSLCEELNLTIIDEREYYERDN